MISDSDIIPMILTSILGIGFLTFLYSINRIVRRDSRHDKLPKQSYKP